MFSFLVFRYTACRSSVVHLWWNSWQRLHAGPKIFAIPKLLLYLFSFWWDNRHRHQSVFVLIRLFKCPLQAIWAAWSITGDTDLWIKYSMRLFSRFALTVEILFGQLLWEQHFADSREKLHQLEIFVVSDDYFIPSSFWCAFFKMQTVSK